MSPAFSFSRAYKRRIPCCCPVIYNRDSTLIYTRSLLHPTAFIMPSLVTYGLHPAWPWLCKEAAGLTIAKKIVHHFAMAHLKALQRPIQARLAEIVTMPNLRLLMPNMDLLCRMTALCFSSCDMPEK